jgi:hypothetical protein
VSPVPAHAPLQQAPHGSAAGLGDPAGTQQRPQTHCAAPDGFRQSPSLAHGEGGTPDSIGLTTQAQPPRAWHSRAPEQQAVRHSSWLKAPQDVPTARQVGCGQPPLQQRRMPPCVSAPHSVPSGRFLRHLPRFFRWHGLHLRFPAMTGWARGSPAARSASPERNPTTGRRAVVGPRDRIRRSKRGPSMRFSSGRSSRGTPGEPRPQLSGDAGSGIFGFAAGGYRCRFRQGRRENRRWSGLAVLATDRAGGAESSSGGGRRCPAPSFPGPPGGPFKPSTAYTFRAACQARREVAARFMGISATPVCPSPIPGLPTGRPARTTKPSPGSGPVPLPHSARPRRSFQAPAAARSRVGSPRPGARAGAVALDAGRGGSPRPQERRTSWR